MFREIFATLERYYSLREVVDFATFLSKYHRIQGSKDLERAMMAIVDILKDLGNIQLNTYTYNYSEKYGLHLPVVGWDVNDGFIEMVKPNKRIIHTFINSKTCVVAHSPPGDVEAPVVYVGEGSEENSYRGVDGKIVLAYGNPYLVYRLGSELGAKGFIFFRTTSLGNSVPYLSLFLTPDEAKRFTAPAVSISHNEAQKIIRYLEKGEEVTMRIFVDSVFRNDAKIIVVEASIGEGERELHIYAHTCHPAGTINDNISGTASLLELLIAFNRAIDKNMLNIPREMKLTFIWFPEYYGSLPYLIEKVENRNMKIDFGVNLDMIGEKQEVTGSTLNIIRPPMFLSNKLYESMVIASLLNALSINSTFSNMQNVLSYRIDIVPYDGGSDHDIYLQFGIPSIMINQWPDKFYHTDQDTIDKFDSVMASRITIAIGVPLYVLATGNIDKTMLSTIIDAYEKFLQGYLKMKRMFSMTTAINKHSTTDQEEKYKYIGPKGIISLRYLANSLPKEMFNDIRNIISNNFMQFLFTRYIPLSLMISAKSLNDIGELIVNEYGVRIELDKIKKMILYLEKLGLISKV